MQTYKIDVSEAEKPLEEYATLQEFFARKIKADKRPIAEPG
jgi:phosphatidylserine decarboxylase